MNAERQKRIASHITSLSGQQQVFDDMASKLPNVDHRPVLQLKADLEEIEKQVPGVLPPFKESELLSHSAGGDRYYSIPAIRSYIARAIGRLKGELGESPTSPVTQVRRFSFVKNSRLRSILERDYTEIQRAFVANCFKSCILLAGGCIEAILLDLLLRHEADAKASSRAPSQSNLSRWDLADLIPVAVDLNLVSASIEKLSHSVREYRNLVHPGNEIRTNLTFDAEEARIALEVLNMVHRDLSD